MSKVTFITQTKNDEKTIEKCINSVLNQTNKDFVYYIVDINSADKTREIIESFNDERIKTVFVNKDNDTLNQTLKEIYASDSEYLSFVEPNNFINENLAEDFIKTAIEETSDMVISGVAFYEPNGTFIGDRAIKESFDMMPNENVVYFKDTFQFYNNFYSKVFKISTLKESNIFINETSNSAKYLEFIKDVFSVSKNISFLKGQYSNLYNKEQFASKNIKFDKFDDAFKQLELLTELLVNTKSDSEKNIKQVNIIFLNTIISCCEYISASKASKKEKLSAIRKIMRNETFINEYNKLVADDVVSIGVQKSLRLFILSNIYTVYENGKTNDELYGYLAFIYPDIEKFWTKSNLNEFIINDKMLIALIQKDVIALNEHINHKTLESKPKLNTEVAFYNAYTLTRDFNDIAFCFDRLEKGFTNKQLDFILNNNSITKSVEDNLILLKFKPLLRNIVLLNYDELCDQIYDIVSTREDLRQDEFLCLADTLGNAARANKHADYLAYSVQMKLLVAIQNKEEDKFNQYIQELKDMNVEEEVINNFTEMYNQQ